MNEKSLASFQEAMDGLELAIAIRTTDYNTLKVAINVQTIVSGSYVVEIGEVEIENPDELFHQVTMAIDRYLAGTCFRSCCSRTKKEPGWTMVEACSYMLRER